MIFSQPQVPPSKEFAKKTQGTPLPLDFQLLCIYVPEEHEEVNMINFDPEEDWRQQTISEDNKDQLNTSKWLHFDKILIKCFHFKTLKNGLAKLLVSGKLQTIIIN